MFNTDTNTHQSRGCASLRGCVHSQLLNKSMLRRNVLMQIQPHFRAEDVHLSESVCAQSAAEQCEITVRSNVPGKAYIIISKILDFWFQWVNHLLSQKLYSLVPRPKKKWPDNFSEFKLHTDVTSWQLQYFIPQSSARDTYNFSSCENGAFLLVEATVCYQFY